MVACVILHGVQGEAQVVHDASWPWSHNLCIPAGLQCDWIMRVCEDGYCVQSYVGQASAAEHTRVDIDVGVQYTCIDDVDGVLGHTCRGQV